MHKWEKEEAEEMDDEREGATAVGGVREEVDVACTVVQPRALALFRGYLDC